MLAASKIWCRAYCGSWAVSLTKVAKKTREQKNALLKDVRVITTINWLFLMCSRQVQDNVDKWEYCWLFEVGNMRNAHLKTVRKLWKECVRCFTLALSLLTEKQLGPDILWSRSSNGQGIGHKPGGGAPHGSSQTCKSALTSIYSRVMSTDGSLY